MERRQAGRFSVRDDRALACAARNAGWWTDRTLADALAAAVNAGSDRPLVMDGVTSLTAKELAQKARALAGALQARMEPGSVVSFMLPNWHEAAVIYLAATLAGMVANPILPSLREQDLRFILPDSETRIVFVPEVFRGFACARMVAGVAAELESPPVVAVVRGDGEPTYQDMLAEEAPFTPVTIDPDHVRMLMYTSGTTGRPKGVLHSHNSIGALIAQLGEHWLVEPGDRFLVPSPISHIGGSIYAFEMPLLLGSTAVLMERWEPAEALGLMQAHAITHMAGATPFLQHLLAAAKAADTRLPDLKVFICGGASVPPSLVREAFDHFVNARVTRVYGSTEVPVTTVGSLAVRGMAEAAETDGLPGIAEVRLSEGGEIRARGPQMLVGYLHPEDEEQAFDDAGFYRTGDQGRFTESGHLVVTGRIKDLIIRNGENIAPKEIEDLLLGHPAIAEVAIVGVPDTRTGEKAVAVIVPSDGAAPSLADLGAFLGTFGVAKFKYPEAVELRLALPKNDAGKVLKHVLRKELSGG
jgi:acyl-CoA synthetase (AMP-forming)/AMP-acid ligase II